MDPRGVPRALAEGAEPAQRLPQRRLHEGGLVGELAQGGGKFRLQAERGSLLWGLVLEWPLHLYSILLYTTGPRKGRGSGQARPGSDERSAPQVI